VVPTYPSARHRRAVTTTAPGRPQVPVDQVDASGDWRLFAAFILMFAGVMRLFDSLWAFRYTGDLPQHLQNATFGDNLKTYGWVYLVVGVILIVAGIRVLYGGQIARWTGIIAAAIGGLSAMAWLPYYPIWSFIYVAIAVLTMYALVAHGGRDVSNL
jgi:low temperature requirement protein LtrA